jgi:hypothetical protein
MSWVFIEIVGFFLNVIVLVLLLCQTRCPFEFCSKLPYKSRYRSHVRTRQFVLRYSYTEKYDEKNFRNNYLKESEKQFMTKVRVINEDDKE